MKTQGSSEKKTPFPPHLGPLFLLAALALFALLTHGPSLNLPFIGDDYVFLDKTREASFWQLWSLYNTDFSWYRPLSREFHFWALQHIFGLHAVGFRLFGIALWLIVISLYWGIARRLIAPRAALIACAAVTSLSLWGTPIIWISGSQDLWMLLFTLAAILLFANQQRLWGCLPFALALLSKETAAVLPALLFGYVLLVEQQTPRTALRRTAPYWGLMFVWVVCHPTLHIRFLHPSRMAFELQHRPPLLLIPIKTLLASLNMHLMPHPLGAGPLDVARISTASALLAAVLALGLRSPVAAGSHPSNLRPPRISQFALLWMALGWLPLLQPSIGWHAYYGCLGVLGAWLLFAQWLQRHARLAIGAIACLTLLQGAQAFTPTWDWGNVWYQRRAGTMLDAIRDQLRREHPAFPPHSRVFLGHIPNNIGLVAGQSPALRVWYRDATLQAGFYSYYRPRLPSEPDGPDFFFRFDSTRGMVEVMAGPENLQSERLSNPDWEDDHTKLAMLFLRAGDPRRAAIEFDKIATLPRRPDAGGLAAICWEVAGDTLRARAVARATAGRMGLSDGEMRTWLAQLRASFPGK